MARLIDADAAIKAMNAVEIHFWEDAEDVVEKCVNILHNAKTVNAVEVVRCRDCKHWDVRPINGRCMLWRCLKLSRVMGDSSFCSYGERKDGDGNG